MRVLIRADSSVEIGAGHVARCSALAEALHVRGVKPTLLTRDLPGGIAHPTVSLDVITIHDDTTVDVRAARVARDWLDSDAEPSLLIVDHYGLNAAWEREARGPRTRVAVIDDLADRQHACDLLVDQTPANDPGSRYAALVPSDCTLLAGPKYAMLRPEFRNERARLRRRDRTVRRCLVFFGGSDPLDLTTRTLEAIGDLDHPDVTFDVVVGMGNPRRELIALCIQSMRNVIYHCQTDSMAVLMAASDLSIGAGGTATWERCCVGLPSLVVITAENQRVVAIETAARGACVNLGDASELTVASIAAALDMALTGHIDLASMSASAMSLTDGNGSARVADALLAT